MVVGAGVDLVEIGRVERSLQRFGDRLVGRLMDSEEAARLPADAPGRARAVALAIAGKEATSKALGTGWSRGVFWRDVVLDQGPAPRVRLKGGAAAVARELGSAGECSVRLDVDGALAIGEVWLLG
jgi:holo-[acyl-carrier protein] synthase